LAKRILGSFLLRVRQFGLVGREQEEHVIDLALFGGAIRRVLRIGLVSRLDVGGSHLGRGQIRLRIKSNVAESRRPVKLVVLLGNVVGRAAHAGEKRLADSIDAEIVPDHGFQYGRGACHGIDARIVGDMEHVSHLHQAQLVGVGIESSVLLEKRLFANVVDHFLVADLDVKNVGLVQ